MNENLHTTQNPYQSEVESQSINDNGSEKISNVQSKAVAWLGVTGSTLLMLSATIFVWSGWNDFPNAAKFGVIAMIAAIPHADCFAVREHGSNFAVATISFT